MRLIYETSNEQVIEMYSTPYRLYFVEGLGDVESETQMQKSPYQDGSSYIDSILEPRHITIEVNIRAESERELFRLKSKLASAFSPKLGLGTLKCVNENGVKEIYAVPESVPFFPDGSSNRGRLFQKTMINLVAPDPYWRDPKEISRDLKAYEGKFTFPFQFPTVFGIESDTTTLENKGDTRTPIIVEIEGPIRRPLLENLTTGKHMQINAMIEHNQTLIIDTNPRNKRVEIRSENESRKVMGFFDHGGDFWQLIPGENEIRYRADQGIAEAVATVSWQNQYVGI